MQFFYLNCGPEQQIVRVEIPAWVGENPTYLERVHAGLVEQTRLTGIPYVLIRAHELAVVGMAERQALDQMMNQILLEHGLDARISQKAQSKRWTGRRRRGA
jgi:hypothetical protein